MSLPNHNCIYAPRPLDMPDVPSYERPSCPHVKNPLAVNCPFSPVYVRDSAVGAHTLPGSAHYNLPQTLGRTAPPSTYSTVAYEPLIDTSPAQQPGNVWDMLVGLLGTEHGNSSINSEGKISASYLDRKPYLQEAELHTASLQSDFSQTYPGMNNYKPMESTKAMYQNLANVLNGLDVIGEPRIIKMQNDDPIPCQHHLHTESENHGCFVSPYQEAKNPTVAASKYVLNSPFSEEEVKDFKRSELIAFRIGDDQLFESSMQVSKNIPQKTASLTASTSMSKQEELSFSKQRKKFGKIRLHGKVTFKAKEKFFLITPEAVQEVTEQNIWRGHSCPHILDQNGDDEKRKQNSVLQLCKSRDNASLSKVTSITMKCCDEKLFVWADTMMKLISPLNKSHSLLMKTHKDEKGLSKTVVLDVQSSLPLENVLGHMKSLKQNSNVFSLLRSHVEKSQNDISKIPPINSSDSNGVMAKTVHSVDVHETSKVLVQKTNKKSSLLEMDLNGEVIVETQGQKVNNHTQTYPQENEVSLKHLAATMDKNFDQEKQLKSLLHADFCQLPECAVTSCAETKKLLKHCFWCQEEESCLVQNCLVSKILLKHWSSCKVYHCPLCGSIRQDHLKSTGMKTRRDQNYSIKAEKIDVPSLARSTNENLVHTTGTITNRKDSTASTMDSTSTCSKNEKRGSRSSKNLIIQPRQHKYPDKINTLSSMQENQSLFAPDVQGIWSYGSQAEWYHPIGSNDLGENLHHVSWTMDPNLEDQQPPLNESEPQNSEEGPLLTAGFTWSAQDLRQRLDCLLHAVTCEKPDQEIPECIRKHCRIMKSSMVHMPSCNEVTSCSNVICLLFNPLLSHWQHCYGSCAVCGPINLKYNKKKILKKISPEVPFITAGELLDKRPDIIIRPQYYLRQYMMDEELRPNNSYTPLVPSRTLDGISIPYTGHTWDQLPGIDCDLSSVLGKPKKSDVGRLNSQNNSSSCSSWDNFPGKGDSTQSLYYQPLESKTLGEMDPPNMPWKTLINW